MGSSVAAALFALLLRAPQPGPPLPGPVSTRPTARDAREEQRERGPGVLRRLAGDLRRTLTSGDSLWVLGAGGAGVLMARPLDGHVRLSRFNSELHDSTTLDGLFEPGDMAGNVSVQVCGPLALLAFGKLGGHAGLTRLGGDLLRAQVVSASLTGAVKLAVRRERPDGSSRLSFPSGHTSAAFATATVIQRRYGSKAGAPAYAVAAWVAASRLNEDKHFLSDVTFGAAIGIAAGRAVTVRRGAVRATLAPLILPGGGAGLQVLLTPRP